MGALFVVIIAFGAIAVFMAGVGLLILYFRSNGPDDYVVDDADAAVYGSLIQCPRCQYMNPPDAAACLNCRNPLPRARSYQSAPPTPPPQAYGYQPAPPTPPPQAYGYRPVPAAPAAAPSPAPVAGATVRHSPPAPVPSSGNGGKSPGDMPHAWVEGISGPFDGQQVLLGKKDSLVGRSAQCDVQVVDPKVSRRHFMIRYANGKFYLQDQDSSRGTYVNGEESKARPLENGDRITIGDSSMIFRVE